MALVKEMYSVNGINRIYQLLKNEAEKGIAKEYDVKVDALKVVGRNNDPERFFEHEAFLLANSKNITVNIYDGSSPRCTRYMLMLTEEAPGKQELSGIEKTINVRLQQERKSWEYDKLKRENAQLRQELTDTGKYSGQLEKQIIALREEKQTMPGKITETLISLAGAYITRNPAALSGIPILGNLLGAGQTSDDTVCEGEVTFEPSQDEDSVVEEGMSTFSKVRSEKLTYTGEATQVDFDRMEKALIPLFPEQHLQTVATVVSVLYHHNELIPEIAELLAQDEQVADNKAA